MKGIAHVFLDHTLPQIFTPDVARFCDLITSDAI